MAKTMKQKFGVQSATVQIGNSDNKLTQSDWSNFYRETIGIIKRHADQVHFSGASYSSEPWQNAAFVFEIDTEKEVDFLTELSACCNKFDQNSIAVTFGDTRFISSSYSEQSD